MDVACDEAIDTAAYPELARHVGGDVDSYDDLDIEDVPADKIVRLPYGDAGLFKTMGLWGPEGCRYPYYGFLPVDPLCDECSSMYAAREAVLDGLWDGPCNDDSPPTCDDDTKFATTPHTPATPANYPGCGCDCADFLRRDLSCTSDACVNVAQAYAASNTVCAGDKLRWDTTANACADTYDPNSQLTGSACLDAGGAVPNATCYRTPAAISEPGFRWPWYDSCYHMQRDSALGRRASAALALAIVLVIV